MYARLFEEIDRMNDAYLDFVEDVCNLESPTADKARIDAVGRYFLNKAIEKGWKTEVYSQTTAGDVVAITLNPEATGSPITLSGHIDTVHPVGLFGSPAVRREGNRMYGPGTADCKGGVVAGFMAMDALEKCGFKDRPVMLLIQTDEEVGSKLSKLETITYICEKALGSAAFFNLETASKDTACLGRKGILRYSFDVHGVAAHSSKCGKEGASAIVEAAHKILKLETLKDGEGMTCNCGLISGGTASNSVPARCSFDADLRFTNNQELEWIKEFVKEVAETTYLPGCSCELTQKSFRPAMPLVDRNLELLNTINTIFETTGLSVLKERKSTGGSDAAYATLYEIPCIDGMGVAGGGVHSKDEYFLMDSLAEAAKRLAAICWYM